MDVVIQGALKRFGASVRRRRVEIGLSQEELAARCELHRTYIGSVERGERNISLQNIVAIAAALRCASSDLMRDVEQGSG